MLEKIYIKKSEHDHADKKIQAQIKNKTVQFYQLRFTEGQIERVKKINWEDSYIFPSPKILPLLPHLGSMPTCSSLSLNPTSSMSSPIIPIPFPTQLRNAQYLCKTCKCHYFCCIPLNTLHVPSTVFIVYILLGWPKNSFGFFGESVWKNQNELSGQFNILSDGSLHVHSQPALSIPI